jgi:hypothetical protein
LAFHSGREAHHSPPSGAEVEEWVELYLHSPYAPSWRAPQLGGSTASRRSTRIVAAGSHLTHFVVSTRRELLD